MDDRRYATRTVWPLVAASLIVFATGPGPLQGASAPVTPVWSWANPWPHGNNIFDLVFHDGTYHQVGDRGQAYVSTDGLLWDPVPTGVQTYLRALTFFHGRPIIVGESGTLLVGTETGEFEAVALGTSDWLEGVAASDSGVVAVGDNGAIYTSTNALVWTRLSAGFDKWLRSVAYGAGEFVAVGENGLITSSTNGLRWTPPQAPTTAHLNRVVHAAGTFHAVTDDGQVLTRRGATWEASRVVLDRSLYSYTESNSQRIVAGESALYRAPPGGIWVQQSLGVPDWVYLSSVWDGDRFLVGGRAGLMLEGVASSNSGGTTSVQPAVSYLGSMPDQGEGEPIAWNQLDDSVRDWLWDVVRVRGRYVAVGDRARVLTSEEGIEWTSEYIPVTLANTVFLGVGGSSNLIVAVGSEGRMMLSRHALHTVTITNREIEYVDCAWVTNEVDSAVEVDAIGLLWHEINANLTTNTLQGVCERDGRFVVVGDSGVVLTSTDGTNWVAGTVSGGPTLSSVLPFANGFLVSGDDGFLAYAGDPLGSWARRETGTANWIYRLREVNGHLVAVGEQGLILTSDDGVDWTPRDSGTSTWLTDVAYLNGQYFVCGTQGTMLTSTNLTTWSASPVISVKSLYALATGPGELIALGVEGVILRAANLADNTAPVSIAVAADQAQQDPSRDWLVFSGQPGQRFVLQASSDLFTWRPLKELRLPEPVLTNSIRIVSTCEQAPPRFYRLETLPP